MFKLLHFSVFEEVLSEVIETEDSYILTNPLRLVLHQTEQGVGIGIEDYIPFVNGKDKKIEIKKDKPIFVINDDDIPSELKNEYNSVFGSGVVIPEKNNKIII